MKKILSVLILFLVFLSLSAVGNDQTLILETVVPENYGINVPDHALHLDQFVFEFEGDRGISELLTESRFSIGNFESTRMQTFTLLFYGNLSTDYTVQISVDTEDGFVRQSGNNEASIPVSVFFEEADEKPEDITVVCDEEYAKAYVTIPPTGPRRGVEVVTLTLLWEEVRDLLPGEYEMAVDIELLSNN